MQTGLIDSGRICPTGLEFGGGGIKRLHKVEGWRIEVAAPSVFFCNLCFLNPQHMDGGARRLAMDVTGANIAYAFARREYAFEKISEGGRVLDAVSNPGL